MDFSDLGNRFVLSVDDLSGVWTPIYEHVKKRLPLRQIPLRNKFGVQTIVDELPVQFLSATDPRLQRLRQYSHSPVTWFRNPFVHLVLVSCEENEDYKRAYRAQLKAMAEVELRVGVAPELLFVYLRPSSVDALAKGPAKIFDSMRRDLSLKRRERCVRLDPAPPSMAQAGLLGLDDLERALKEAIRASFEARSAAYDEEVRRLMLSRQHDPSWSFPNLFLCKDSLAVMMEAGGMLDDALREYFELEAVYLEILQASHLTRQGFGSKAPDADEAALMWRSWHGIRQAVLQGDSVPEFAFRQFLFASQARVLLKQHRLVELGERGLNFIRVFMSILQRKESEGQVPPQFSAAWAFASAASLAGTLSTLHAQRSEHRRQSEQGRSVAVSRWKSKTLGAPSRPASPMLGAPGTPPSPAKLPGGAGAPRPGSGGGSSAAEGGTHGSGGGDGDVGSQGGTAVLEQNMAAEPGSPSVNWALGSFQAPEGDEQQGRSHRKGDSTGALFSVLGNLYANARSELMQLGESLGLHPPHPQGAEMLDALLRDSTKPATAQDLSLLVGTRSSTGRKTPFAATRAPHSHAVPQLPPLTSPVPAPAPAPAPLPSLDENGPHLAGEGEGGAGEESMQAVDLTSEHAAHKGSQGQGQPPLSGVVPPLDLAGSRGSDSAPSSAAKESDPGAFVVRHVRGASVVSNLSWEGSGAMGGPDYSRPPSTREDSTAGAGVRKLLVKTRAPQDTESQASTPKSTVSHVSSSPTRSAQHAQQQSAAAVLAGAQGAAPFTPGDARSQLLDARAIERQVVSPAASLNLDAVASTFQSSSQKEEGAVAVTSGRGGAAGQDCLPPWLVHWRLRMGLASEELFNDLWRCLSEAAAGCYLQAGRRRHAALLRADVADVLLWQGQVHRAAQLYHHQCRVALGEGWFSLAAHTLPKLAACQLALGGQGLAHTAAAMLAVPPHVLCSRAEERLGCQLLQWAAAGGEPQAPLGAPMFSPLLGALLANDVLSLPHVLTSYPAPHLTSRFFGVSNGAGTPVLSPPAVDQAQQPQGLGAVLAAVGDVMMLEVHVLSAVPAELPLSAATLTLGVLQQLTVLSFPTPPSPASPPTPTTPPLSRLSATSTAALPQDGTPRGVADRQRGAEVGEGTAAGSRGGGRPSGTKYSSRWQEVEELQCRLVGIASAARRGGGQCGGRALVPGENVLTFLASPVKPGLYVTKHVQVVLGVLPIHIDVSPLPSLLSPDCPSHRLQQQWGEGEEGQAPPSQGLPAPRPLHSVLGGRGRRGSQSMDGVLGPALSFGGERGAALGGGWGSGGPAWEGPLEEAVVMVVEPARPRVGVWPAAAGGRVIAGQRQWLGLVLHPERDSLRGASLVLTWPAADAGATPGGAMLRRTATPLPFTAAASHASPQKTASTGSIGVHRATVSFGGATDAGLRRAPAPAAPPPLALAPLSAAAVVRPLGPACSADGLEESTPAGVEEVVVEESAPEASSWALGQMEEQQQFRLPAWADDAPACCIWWWVEAGIPSTRPEAVKIAPPGSHPMRSRSRDLHCLSDDTPCSPAAPTGQALSLAVNLEYDSGCHRSHSRTLTLPITHPFAVHCTARELDDGTVAVQVTLRSNLAVPFTLTSCALAPQPGLELQDSVAQRMGLLPQRLPAGASSTLLFLLRLSNGVAGGSSSTGQLPHAGPGRGFDRAATALRLQQAAKLQPSVLSVEYELDSWQLCSVPALAVGPSRPPGAWEEPVRMAGHGQALAPPTRPLREPNAKGAHAAASLPPRPWTPLQASVQHLESMALESAALEEDSAEGEERSTGGGSRRSSPSPVRRLQQGEGRRQQCSFTRVLVLQLAPPEDDRQGAMVLLRLLGPFTAVAGQPITLCWRLERSVPSAAVGASHVDAAQPAMSEAQAVPLQFEVLAEGDSWRPLGRQGGRVSLGSAPGSVATIEATWVPLTHGTLAVPTLKIPEIQFQELYDVGKEDNLIRVLPGPQGGAPANGQ